MIADFEPTFVTLGVHFAIIFKMFKDSVWSAQGGGEATRDKANEGGERVGRLRGYCGYRYYISRNTYNVLLIYLYK